VVKECRISYFMGFQTNLHEDDFLARDTFSLLSFSKYFTSSS
jgi:hypothetical protein